jgi:hypothetical protein
MNDELLFDEFKDLIFFDYFVIDGTTPENVEINVIEYMGDYPDSDEINPNILEWVKSLFKDGIIKLGTIRDNGDDGDEYYVTIKESKNMWEIRYDIPEEDFPEKDNWSLYNTTKVVYLSK